MEKKDTRRSVEVGRGRREQRVVESRGVEGDYKVPADSDGNALFNEVSSDGSSAGREKL